MMRGFSAFRCTKRHPTYTNINLHMSPLLLLFVVALVSGSTVGGESPCVLSQSCGECVALDAHVCAWCAGPLRHLNGTWTTNHCVRQIDYGNEFLCFEQLSVGTCQVGFQCNATLGQCVQTHEVGTGDTLDHCQGTCNCTSAGCGQFGCFGSDDLFTCAFDPSGNSTTTLSTCSATCGTSSATPIPAGPGGCTPDCTVPCHPLHSNCCDGGVCTFDIVWNDYRCHVPGRDCTSGKL